MTRIAEELLLLLLDNGAAKPALEQARLRRLLSAAVLLDLAHACRIRPTMPGDDAAANRLIALVGFDMPDPASSRAWTLLARRPISAARAIAKLQNDVEGDLHGQLERTGQIRRVAFNSSGFKRRKQQQVWLLTDRTRASQARAAMLSTLIDGTPPAPATAAVISLLHAADGLGALLSFDQRGWQWVNGRAGEIASGSWIAVDTDLADVNLAVTAAAMRSALAG